MINLRTPEIYFHTVKEPPRAAEPDPKKIAAELAELLAEKGRAAAEKGAAVPADKQVACNPGWWKLGCRARGLESLAGRLRQEAERDD